MAPEINKKKENKYDLEDRLIDFANYAKQEFGLKLFKEEIWQRIMRK